MKFTPQEPGEWVMPKRRGYLMACCDCGLVHRINFHLEKRGKRNYIFLQAFREEKETKKLRRRERMLTMARKIPAAFAKYAKKGKSAGKPKGGKALPPFLKRKQKHLRGKK